MPKKVISGSKQDKRTSPLNSAYLNYSKYQISYLSDNFACLERTCPQRVFSFRTNLRHHRIQHIQIGIDTTFHLK